MSGALKKIVLKNFQKHKDRTFEFGPGVNLIVAVSDSGKTSIMRAVYWVMFNRPMGLASLRYDPELAMDDGTPPTKADVTSVEVVFEDGWVRRERNELDGDKGGVNRYVLSGHPGPFSALNGNVPGEVRAFLNLDEEFSVQMQHDPYFLIQWTPGEVAGWLNEVSGLAIIDRTSASIKSIADEAKREGKKTSERILSMEGKLERLQRYVPAGDLIVGMDVAVGECDVALRDRGALLSVADSLEEVEGSLVELSEWLTAEDQCVALSALVEESCGADAEAGRLESLACSLAVVDGGLVRVDGVVGNEGRCVALIGLVAEQDAVTDSAGRLVELSESLAWIELKLEGLGGMITATSTVVDLEGRIAAAEEDSIRAAGIGRLLDQLIGIGERIGNLEEALIGKVKEYTEVMVEAGVCYACGTENVDRDTVARHVKELL